MTATKEVAVETDLSVRWLIARWAQLIDDRDFEAAAALFTEDGRFRILEEDLVGRPAISGWLATIPDPIFHHVTNVVVSNGSQPGTFHAVSDVMVGGRGEKGWAIWMLGRYHDSFVGEGRDIRLTQRIVTNR